MTLLEHNAFKREGLARAYLKIDGAWRDHLLFGLVTSRS
jgi:ribosomal-protein-alanine N-acetyltransferase